MKNANVILSVIIILALSSCRTVDYVGKSYEKTDQIDIYFDENEISKNYEIIGQAIGEGGRMKKIQERLIKKAKNEGADGIIIGGIYRDRSFDVTGSSQLHRQISASFVKYK